MPDDEFMLGSCSDSCSDRVRIGRALELTLQLFSANFSLILECTFAWQAQYLWRVMPGVPRIVNDVSNATDINHESHFAWQAQYLVMSEFHFSWIWSCWSVTFRGRRSIW